MIDNKVQCPLCDKKATWSYWFFKHFIGTHINNCEDLELLKVKTQEGIKEKSIDSEKEELILNVLNEVGPEEYEIQGGLIKEDCNDSNKETSVQGYCLNDYFGSRDKKPVCREERQFALFLANSLKANNSSIMCKLNLDPSNVEIFEVYYEATLMRDYWNVDKINFNNKLRNYITCIDNKYKYSDRMICEHANYWDSDDRHPLACWMMNAKPDLAILYKEVGDHTCRLTFFECKYGSKEDKYSSKIIDKVYEKTQIEVQDYILGFLCNSLGIHYKKNEHEYVVDKGDVRLVQFVAEESGDSNECKISLECLVENGYRSLNI